MTPDDRSNADRPHPLAEQSVPSLQVESCGRARASAVAVSDEEKDRAVFIGFAVVVIAAGLFLAGWAGIWAYRRLPTNDPLMVSAIVLEALLLVQAVIGLVRVSSAGLVEPATFIAYTLGVLLPLPLGFYLARIERTRWGSVSLAFTALVTAVMTLRMLQIWRNTGG